MCCLHSSALALPVCCDAVLSPESRCVALRRAEASTLSSGSMQETRNSGKVLSSFKLLHVPKGRILFLGTQLQNGTTTGPSVYCTKEYFLVQPEPKRLPKDSAQVPSAQDCQRNATSGRELSHCHDHAVLSIQVTFDSEQLLWREQPLFSIRFGAAACLVLPGPLSAFLGARSRQKSAHEVIVKDSPSARQ